jgi:hypothetical protein
VVAKDKISSCAWNWLHILTDGQILERPLISAAILSWFFLQLVSGFVLIVASNVCYMSFDFFHIFTVSDFCTSWLEITNIMPLTKGNRQWPWWAHQVAKQKHGWHRFFIRKHITFSPMPFVSYKIILGFIELVTGALTKGCTCMHIIILILSEIDIYFAYIYIYKFHSYPPLCSALFIWVNYTWPLKKKKKKKLAKFTKLLKPQNWKKKIKKK